MLGAQVFQKPALETAEYARTVAEPMPPDGYFGRKTRGTKRNLARVPNRRRAVKLHNLIGIVEAPESSTSQRIQGEAGNPQVPETQYIPSKLGLWCLAPCRIALLAMTVSCRSFFIRSVSVESGPALPCLQLDLTLHTGLPSPPTWSPSSNMPKPLGGLEEAASIVETMETGSLSEMGRL